MRRREHYQDARDLEPRSVHREWYTPLRRRGASIRGHRQLLDQHIGLSTERVARGTISAGGLGGALGFGSMSRAGGPDADVERLRLRNDRRSLHGSSGTLVRRGERSRHRRVGRHLRQRAVVAGPLLQLCWTSGARRLLAQSLSVGFSEAVLGARTRSSDLTCGTFWPLQGGGRRFDPYSAH